MPVESLDCMLPHVRGWACIADSDCFLSAQAAWELVLTGSIPVAMLCLRFDALQVRAGGVWHCWCIQDMRCHDRVSVSCPCRDCSSVLSDASISMPPSFLPLQGRQGNASFRQQLKMEANFLSPPLQELRQWRNIAFCLAQLGMGERGLRRMADLLRCYKAALHDGEVLACLQVGQPGIGAVLHCGAA